MAQEIVGIKIQVGGQEKVLSSMGEIRKELKSAQFDVLKFSEAFGASSKEAIEAAKRVAQLKDAIGDAKDLVGAFNPDAKFRALSGSIQGVAGGFAALQGALGLVGVEGENVQKTLLKVQSALALSEGLNSVMGSIDAFKNLGAVIKNTVVNAFSSLRNAIMSTGILALVAGVGLLIANFDKVKETLTNIIPGFGRFISFIESATTAITDFVGITNAADRALDKLNKTTQRSNEDIDNRIKILTAQGGKEKEIYELTKQRGENELNFLRQKLKEKGKLSDEELKKFRELKTEQQVLDAKEQKRLDDKSKEEKKKSDEKSKQTREQIKKDADERAAAEKEAAERIVKLKGETEVLGIKDEYEAKRKAIENQLAIDIKQVQDNEKLKSETKTALIKELERKAQADVVAVVKEEMDAANEVYTENQKKYNETQKELRIAELQSKMDDLDRENQMYEGDFEADQERIAMQKEILDEQEVLELEKAENNELLRFEIKQKYTDKRNALTKSEVEIEKEAQKAKVELNLKYIDLYAQFGALLSQVAGKNKALAIAGLVIEKGAAVAKIITQMRTIPAFLTPSIPNPAYIPSRIAGALSIASVIAATAQGIQTINSAGIPGGSSGGSGGGGSVGASAAAPIAPVAPITNTVTQLDSQSINQMGNATNRAYVIESDVTNSQERIKRINRAARLT